MNSRRVSGVERYAYPLNNLRNPPFCLRPDSNERSQRHAALAGSAKRSANDTVEEIVLVGVGEDGRVVFGTEIGLDSLAVR
jgi:hypothetical protein